MRPWLFLVAHLLSFTSLLWSASASASSTGSKVLVILEPELSRDDFSTFFGGLEEKGYELTFRAPKDKAPAAIEDDVPQFDHIVIFAPNTKSYSPDINPQSLVDLLSRGVNMVFALGPSQSPLTSLAAEFSLILPPPHTPLVSHFPEREQPHTVIPVLVSSSDIISSNSTIWFSGIPHATHNNPYLIPIVKAPAESFAAETKEDSAGEVLVDAADKGGEGLWAGSSMGLVTGFQTRVNSRAMWVGGVEVFTDAFALKEVSKGVPSGNAQFSKDIAAWAFQETSVYRIEDVTHHKVGESSPPEMYTTNDEAVFTAHISRWDPKSSSWKPYSGIDDLQLEFTMLDPHIRTILPAVPNRPGEYSLQFRVPDRHGVFKFVIDYKRKGKTLLYSATTVPVIPPRHDGYPRFLSSAWPYYTGAMSTSVGFVVFSALYLGGDFVDRTKKKVKGPKAE